MFCVSLLALAGASAATVAAATLITSDPSVAINQTFDYVIAGAGLTGIVVGNKISAKGYRVLIIEAGPNSVGNTAVSDAEARNNLNGFCNWQYPAFDKNGTRLWWNIDSGACVGGSTSINGMVWFRPTVAEIDSLQIFSDSKWTYSALEPYMSAIERNNLPDRLQIMEGAGIDTADHGFQGVVNVSFPNPMRIPGAVSLYKKSLASVLPDLTIGPDLSDRENEICASTSWTIWNSGDGKTRYRSSAADALLFDPSQQRDTLVVLTDHKVASVIMSQDGNVPAAKGLRFGNTTTGVLHDVYAKKEVLLASGTLGTPAVLERSGIGNKSVLRNVGIPQLVDLPGVGTNLHDQPGTLASALVLPQFVNNTEIIDDRNLFAPVISQLNLELLFQNQSASIGDALKNSLQTRAQKLVSDGASASLQGAIAMLTTVTDLIVDAKNPIGEFIGESYPQVLSAIFWPTSPLSRGYVHINTTDPFKDPYIVPNLLEDPFDVQVAVSLLQLARTLFQTAPLARVVQNAFAVPSVSPGPGHDEQGQLEAYLKGTSFGASHWVGTCAMMPRNMGGVVDPSLRVYGAQNLRIIDGSILPYEVSSHLMSILYATSQMAADIILADA